MIWIWFGIFAIGLILIVLRLSGTLENICLYWYDKRHPTYLKPYEIVPWNVTDYYARIKKVYYDILREREKLDDTIIFLVGLDYLVLSKGIMEWERKMEPKPLQIDRFLAASALIYPSLYSSITSQVVPSWGVSAYDAAINLNRLNLQTQLQQYCNQIQARMTASQLTNAWNAYASNDDWSDITTS